MTAAVFLDRDGVINHLVLNPLTREYEPPHRVKDLELIDGVIQSLHALQDAGLTLFIVSNQPDYAKGKASLAQIRSIHQELDEMMKKEGITFRDYYYCYHHPEGIIPELSFQCDCRKPKPYFLLKAARDYGVSLSSSWMVGDRDSDIECGLSAGSRTILVEEPHSCRFRGNSRPDFTARDLKSATEIILRHLG